MKEIIDIYSKLIIAVISFFAPLIIHLLTIYIPGKPAIKAMIIGKIGEFTKLGSTLNVNLENEEELKGLKKALKGNLMMINYYESLLKVLNPKKQIITVFLFLFASLGLLAIYYLFKHDMRIKGILQYNKYFYCIIAGMILSLTCFSIGILKLKQIAWAIIDVKPMIEESEKTQNIEEEELLDEETLDQPETNIAVNIETDVPEIYN